MYWGSNRQPTPPDAGAVAIGERDALQREVVHLRAENQRLTNEMLTLKREGFHPPAAMVPTPSSIEDLPLAVLDALSARAEPGSSLWGVLAADARTLLRRGDYDASDVAAEILRGGNPDEL